MDKFKFSQLEKDKIGDMMYGPIGTDTIDYFIQKIETLISSRADGWVKVEDGLPKEAGRYLCWVTEQNDLGKSGFVWNCCFHIHEESWSDNLKEMHVTHWQPLPSPPKTAQQ